MMMPTANATGLATSVVASRTISAHEVAGYARTDHAREGDEHRQRYGSGHDQPTPDISEHQEQNGDDQDSSLEEVLLDGVDGPAYEVVAVVELIDGDARR